MSTPEESDTKADGGRHANKTDGHSLPYVFSMEESDASLQEPIDAKINGKVPDWLKGSLYRNGSGVYKIGDTVGRHLFDGFAVIHRWTIQDGRVTYLSTALDSDHFNKCFAANRIIGVSFGSYFPDPCKSIFRRFFSHFLPLQPESSDNTAVNIVQLGDRLFAMTETTMINEVNPKTMKCDGKVNLKDYLALHMGTAHPHFEKDGTVLYYGTNFDYKKAYNIVRATPPQDNRAPLVDGKIIASIPSRWKTKIGYNHSFGMSENFIIVLELPFVINVWKLLTVEMKMRAVVDTMETFPDEKILLHVVDKMTGHRLPIIYQAPHGFVFHFINCFEEENHLVVDVCLLSDAAAMKNLYLESLAHDMSSGNQANFARFVLPLSNDGAQIGDDVNHLTGSQAKAILTGKSIVDVDAERIFGTNLHFDLPRINYESFNGLKYRYVYGSTSLTKDPIRKILKLDIATKRVQHWSCPDENYEAGEPVFVPHPDATDEDEGVVLCPVVSTVSDNQSFLVILDASTFQELATASIPVDVKMNITFHGNFTFKVF